MNDESGALREKVESHIKWRAERFFGSNDTKTEPLLRDMLAIIAALEVEVTWHESDHAAALAQIESLREALRDFLEANELGAHLLDTHPTVVRARTLLDGDDRG